MTWLGLEDKIVIVTGGSGGIGQACLTAFYEAGARVVSLDYTYDKAEEAAAKLDPTGKRALGLGCDVGDADAVQAAADAAGVHFGPADVVVNNAGILRPAGLETIAEADWMQLLQVNLNGSLLVAQAFGRQMIAKGAGAIVQIASIAGTQPQPSSGAYSASKAAVLMMIRQLAYEWGPKGLRANSVSPGLVITPLSA
ncbi:MAG: SDR family NAD(P)-dependent oxidoreductase, partial [Mangrovicoccus sp.]